MKYNDYKRLGKISIQSRKKSTKNTVRGISFGLILLIPIIFFGLAFYIDLTGTVNNIKSISSFNVTTNHYNDDSGNIVYNEDDYQIMPLLAYNNLNNMISFEGVEDYLVSEKYDLPTLFNITYPNDAVSKLIIDEKIVELDFYEYNEEYPFDDQNTIPSSIKFLHQDLSSQPYISQAEADDLKKHYNKDSEFIAGSGFTGDGKKQVILSEAFIKRYDINIDDILNKKVDLQMPASLDNTILLDDDNIPDNQYNQEIYNEYIGKTITIFKDFTVVGIIDEDLFKLQSRDNDSHIWFHKNSLYGEETFFPTITNYRMEYEQWYEEYHLATYENEILATMQAANDYGAVFIPFGLGGIFLRDSYWNQYYQPVLQTLIQCEDYYSAMTVERSLNAVHETVFGERGYLITNNTFSLFSQIYTTGLYLIVILLCFGGTIFFATLLNLYNSINYSVQSRKNYIGVMRAIGAKESLIPKLYFIEIMLIFMRAFIWILIFSGLISFGIKSLVDYGFRTISDVLTVTLELNFIYFPITIILMVLFEFLVALIYSQVACRYVSKKPILEILKDEK